jgi:hypothetical protein
MGGLAAVKMQTELRRSFAPHKKSGDTQRATSVKLDTVTATSLSYVAKADTPQARFVNDGTNPHPIAPKANPGAIGGPKRPLFIVGEPLLVFFWARVGRVVRFRWVDHPGYKGSGWWDYTIAQWHDFLEEALDSLPSNV